MSDERLPRRIPGTEWDFLGGGRNWYCLGCGQKANAIPDAAGTLNVICGCGNRAALNMPKEA